MVRLQRKKWTQHAAMSRISLSATMRLRFQRHLFYCINFRVQIVTVWLHIYVTSLSNLTKLINHKDLLCLLSNAIYGLSKSQSHNISPSPLPVCSLVELLMRMNTARFMGVKLSTATGKHRYKQTARHRKGGASFVPWRRTPLIQSLMTALG
jgi:hypothetical protein